MRSTALTAMLAVLLLAAPAAATPPAAVQGSHLYGQYCLKCHGPNGEGTAGVAPSLHGVGALAADFYLRTGYMPLAKLGVQPRRTRVLLSEAQITALVAYVASLGKGPPVPQPHPARGTLSEGMHLFTEHCAGCHQVAAVGGYVTGALPPPLGSATPTQVAEAVRIGPYVMPRFSPQAISDEQLDSLVAYVEYAKHPDDPGGWSLGRLGPVPEGIVAWLVAAVACVGFCVIVGDRLRRA